MRPQATRKGRAQSAIRDCNMKDDDKKKTAQLLANRRSRLWAQKWEEGQLLWGGAIRAQIVRPPPYRLRISVIGLRKLGCNKTQTKNISSLNHVIPSSTLILQCSGAKIWKSEYSGKVSGKLGVGEWGNRWAKYARGTVGTLPLPLLWCFCYLQAGNPNETAPK